MLVQCSNHILLSVTEETSTKTNTWYHITGQIKLNANVPDTKNRKHRRRSQTSQEEEKQKIIPGTLFLEKNNSEVKQNTRTSDANRSQKKAAYMPKGNR